MPAALPLQAKEHSVVRSGEFHDLNMHFVVCLFVLRFYDPVNTIQVMSNRTILGRLADKV